MDAVPRRSPPSVGALIAVCVVVSGCTVVGFPGSNIRGCVGRVVDTHAAAIARDTVTIVALGDFGTSDGRRNVEVAAALRAFLESTRLRPTAAVLLGDNFYHAGLIGQRHCALWPCAADPTALRRQIDEVLGPFEFLREQTTSHVVPGNHDHGCPRLGSLDNEANIDRWLPADQTWGERWQFHRGLPSAVGFKDTLQIVFLDSEVMIEDREFLAASLHRLTELLTTGAYRWRIVAAHHPLYANGPHDGAWWAGAILKALYYPLHVLVFPPFLYGNQATYEWKYRRYREGLEAVFATHPVDAFLAGHEHALALLAPAAAGQPLNVTSGAGAECSPVMRRDNTLFAASKNGFGVLTASRDRLSIAFVGTTACEEERVCAQPVRAGEWHTLFELR